MRSPWRLRAGEPGQLSVSLPESSFGGQGWASLRRNGLADKQPKVYGEAGAKVERGHDHCRSPTQPSRSQEGRSQLLCPTQAGAAPSHPFALSCTASRSG
jgi:hypothetical protein